MSVPPLPSIMCAEDRRAMAWSSMPSYPRAQPNRFAITDESRAVNETLAILMVVFEFSSAVLTTIRCLQAFHAAGSSWREQKGSLLYLIFEQGMHYNENHNYFALWCLLVRFAGIGILYFRWEEYFKVVMGFKLSTFNILQYYFLFCYWYCYPQLRAFLCLIPRSKLIPRTPARPGKSAGVLRHYLTILTCPSLVFFNGC